METYINQLLEDLRVRTQQPLPAPDYRQLNPDHPAWEYDLPHIVAWETSSYQPTWQLLQLPEAAFPPAERLTVAKIFPFCLEKTSG